MVHSDIINQTKKWITDVVIGCNFCPFAAREVKRGTVHYEVLAGDEDILLAASLSLMQLLDENEAIETALLILPNGFEDFEHYLDLVENVQDILEENDYEGIYQVASFHPGYMFEGSNEQDASNYTNRSPYPMLHFLRESSVSKAVDSYPDIDSVPERNIRFAQEKGLSHMQQLLAQCMLNQGRP
ncbi:MAG: DUF1415 domain-containing protein [Ferruginibacter sp.]